MIEQLEWHDAATDKPDAMLTVLTWRDDPEYPFENGYWNGEQWISDISGGDLPDVTHWSLPRGPQ